MHLVGCLQRSRHWNKIHGVIPIASPTDVRRGGDGIHLSPLQRAPGAGALVVDLDGGDPRPVDLRVVRYPEVVQLPKGPRAGRVGNGTCPSRNGVLDEVVQVNAVHLKCAYTVPVGIASPEVGQVDGSCRPARPESSPVDEGNVGIGELSKDLSPPTPNGTLLEAARNQVSNLIVTRGHGLGAVPNSDIIGGGQEDLVLHPLKVGVVRGVVDWSDGEVHILGEVDLREGDEALLCPPQVQVNVDKGKGRLQLGADGHPGAVDVLRRGRRDQGRDVGHSRDQDVDVQPRQGLPVCDERRAEKQNVHRCVVELPELPQRHGELLHCVERGVRGAHPVLDHQNPQGEVARCRAGRDDDLALEEVVVGAVLVQAHIGRDGGYGHDLQQRVQGLRSGGQHPSVIERPPAKAHARCPLPGQRVDGKAAGVELNHLRCGVEPPHRGLGVSSGAIPQVRADNREPPHASRDVLASIPVAVKRLNPRRQDRGQADHIPANHARAPAQQSHRHNIGVTHDHLQCAKKAKAGSHGTKPAASKTKTKTKRKTKSTRTIGARKN
eukprot:RCo016026